EVITPKSERVFALEGDNVTLSCNYSGSVRGVHWYRQYAGSPPQFLILEDSGVVETSKKTVVYADPPIPRLDGNMNVGDKKVDLEISSAEVSDSALYYCALRPTVTEKCRSEDTVDQPDKHVTEAEGRSVTLQCKYKTDSVQENVFWFIQRANDFPKYILRRSKYGGENGTEFQERFHSELSSNSVPLMIKDVSVSDSAVYYCALRPTVTGNTETLYKNLSLCNPMRTSNTKRQRLKENL
ncbi:hypothetical protein PO909_031110, partial [Leuciscus waleckii]